MLKIPFFIIVGKKKLMLIDAGDPEANLSIVAGGPRKIGLANRDIDRNYGWWNS